MPLPKNGFTGIREIILSDEELAKFYETKQCPIELNENEYLLLKKETDEKDKYEYLDKYRWNGKRLIKLNYKSISNTYANKIKPLNVKQECAFDLLQNDDITVKLITGCMGGGKTFLSAIHALDKIEKTCDKPNGYKKIIYIRNNVEVKDTMPLGILPNGLKEKLMPFIMPIVDILGSAIALQQLESQEKIEYCHIGHLRGRSFSNAIIIVSESENLTREHVKLLIGRVAEHSQIIFEGDLSQVDKKTFEDNSGILALRKVLNGNQLFGAVDLDKSERSKTAELSNLF